MLPHHRALPLYWSCIVALMLILIMSPRGCTSDKIEATSSFEGNPVVILTPEEALKAKSKISISDRYSAPEIFAESFSKTDWLFLVFYEYKFRADLSTAPAIEGNFIELQTGMPGEITSANAATIKDGLATWKLRLGHKYKMKVTSRYLRSWLIALVGLLALMLIYSKLSLSKSDNNRIGKTSSI